MSTFDIYVHGTPKGHQIWGSNYNHDYINTFYDHDLQVSEKVFLQIDICDGDTFYTYIRNQNIQDVEGRPKAFFALTVGFRKEYSTNVYLLYKLFDAVYDQICLGSILKQNGNNESYSYLVQDFTQAQSGSNAVVDTIKAAFNQKVAELIVPTLKPLSESNTFNRPKKTISLLEVDSPLFFDNFKKYSIIVSPNTKPAAIAFDAVSTELKQVRAQKDALSSTNEQLQSDLASLLQEKQSLTNQLHASTSSVEKKYKAKFEQLQTELGQVVAERNSLKQKIQEATSSLELIDQPVQKLTRLLAGQFPEKRSQRRSDYLDDKQEPGNRFKKPIWRDWLTNILLGLILVCCVVTFLLVLKENNDAAINPPISKEIIDETINDSVEESGTSDGQNVDQSYVDKTGANGTIEEYDDWENCFPNIVNGGEKLKLNQYYSLFVSKKGTNNKAHVPDGNWEVFVDQGQVLNTDAAFILTDASSIGKKVTIQYVVNNKPVLSRECQIID